MTDQEKDTERTAQISDLLTTAIGVMEEVSYEQDLDCLTSDALHKQLAYLTMMLENRTHQKRADMALWVAPELLYSASNHCDDLAKARENYTKLLQSSRDYYETLADNLFALRRRM